MLLGRVIGRVVPCVVTRGLEGVPMLLLQPLGKDGAPKGKALVAADPTRMAGEGELVAYEGGREAALLLDPWFVPVDHAVVGIVDALHLPRQGEGVITGIVIGEITATIRHPFFEGKKLLVVARTGADGAETGDYVVAIDAVGVGPGDPVLVLDEGNGARQVVGSATAPVRTVVVGFLDRVDLA